MVAHNPAEAMTFAALSIAGSDSSGGAGIQADLAAFNAAGVHGATAITAVTAQNHAGVRAVQLMPPALVRMQIEAAFDECAVHAVKLGMLGNAGIVETVAATLRQHRPRWLVIDPVMIASSGARLLDADAIGSVRRRLLPLADCLAPNLDEAAALLDMPRACSETEMLAQGRALRALGARAVLMKGGHAPLPEAVDLLVTAEGSRRYAAPWIKDIDTHGTGCTLSAAITAGLARGLALVEAIDAAKRHLGVWLGGRLSRA